MHIPTPTDSHARLQFFSGSWSGEEALFPSPWSPAGGKATGYLAARMLDGFFLIADYRQERDGQVTFRGHGVFGYDAADDAYTMHWFDSMGADPGAPVRGKWAGNHLVFQHHTHMGHVRYAYVIEGDDRYTFAMSFSQDGENWQVFLEGQYQRQG